MKKSIVSILLAVCFVTGCGKAAMLDEIDETDKTEETEETDVAPAEDSVEEMDGVYSRPELNAYYEVATDYLEAEGGGFGIELLYIDDDDYYEMAIMNNDVIDLNGALLYTYKDGKAVSLANDDFAFYGIDGAFSYVERDNFFCFSNSTQYDNGGRFEYNAFGITDGEAVPYCLLFREFSFDDSIEDVFRNCYTGITESEYNSLYEEYWYNKIDNLINVDYRNCSRMHSEADIDAFFKEHLEDPDTTPYTEDELLQMTPEELFKAFCDNRAQAECFSDEPGGESHYMDASYLDFNQYGDVTEVVEIMDPYDVDNDGEPEFILSNPVYGLMIFDCKDGKIRIFAHGEGTTGVCSYVTYKDAVWVLHQDTTHTGRRYYSFEKFDGDLNVVDSFNLYWTADDDEEKNKTFYYNDEVITEDQFNSYYSEIFG